VAQKIAFLTQKYANNMINQLKLPFDNQKCDKFLIITYQVLIG
jgi:hypothetical protein